MACGLVEELDLQAEIRGLRGKAQQSVKDLSKKLEAR